MRALDALVDAAIGAVQRSVELGSPIIYEIPNEGEREVVCNPQSIRIDIRRDLRMKLQVAKQGYVTTGTIRDDNFVLPFPVGVYDTSTPIKLMWYGEIPEDASLSLKLHQDSDDVELTQIGYGTFANGGWRTYQLPASERVLYAEATLSGDSEVSPTFVYYRVTRPAIRQPKSGLNLEAPTVMRVRVNAADRDPSTESATVISADLANRFENPLRLRSDFPVRIETEYDKTDSTKRSVLFTGRVRPARHERKGSTRTRGLAGTLRSQYPHERWGIFTMDMVPEWESLAERVVQKGLDLAKAELTDIAGDQKPMRVTDAIRILLQQAGYSDGQIDVPESQLRFFAADRESLILEPYTPIGEAALRFARDYLGGYLVWDPNASGAPLSGVRGMWRLKYVPGPRSLGKPVSGYRTLAAFELQPVVGGQLVHSPAAYPDGGSSVQPIKRTFVRKGSLSTDPYPPEFNLLTVTGVGNVPPGGVAQSATNRQEQLTLRFYNSDSTQFPGEPAPDPTHPDHLGYIREAYYGDPGLTSENAVRWVGTRLSDLGMHGGVRASFEAPLLLVWDTSDPYQIAPRPLRFGDAVTIDSQPFFIDHLVVDYASQGKGGDRKQMAMYSCFYPSNA